MARRMGFDEARHLLFRAGFGPKHAAIVAASKSSREAAVASLITAQRTTASQKPPSFAGARPLRFEIREMKRAARKSGDKAKDRSPEEAALMQKGVSRAVELKGWWFKEIAHTPSPLTEKMVLFWHNHFTSSLRKVKSPVLLYNQHALIRQHALGSFKEMLSGIARDPAMILYLDNVSNRRRKPNENFARELLELFTLGEGHYTEQDIKEAARAFTGWTIDRQDGKFRFASRQHDSGQKIFLGKRGNFGGDDILAALLENPQTSLYIVGKLWREFVSEEVGAHEKEIARLARLWRESQYDISVLMQAMLSSDHFYAPEHFGARIKSPIELMAGTIRLFDFELDRVNPALAGMRALGQDLFDPPNVKGWPGGEAWITSDTLLKRQHILTRTFRDPGNFPTLLKEGWSAMLPASVAKDKTKRVARITEAVLAIAPVYTIDQDSQDVFETARALALDPSYQVC